MGGAGQPPFRWRLIVTEPATGPWNMSVDEVLMESVRRGGAPTLRLYRWAPPCLSFGRNQPARDAYPADRLRRLGIDAVRRRTGGRAVLHDEELTYSVVAPARALGSARQAYLRINQVLHVALLGLGAGTLIREATFERAPVPSNVPCFAESLPGEILVDGRKLVGSAQLHHAGVLLQHGSLLLRPSPLGAALDSIDVGAAYLADALPSLPSHDALNAALAAAWRQQIGPLAPARLSSRELRTAEALQAHYRDPLWTWRR